MSRLHWYFSRQWEQLPFMTLLAWTSVLLLILTLLWLIMLSRVPEPAHTAQQAQVAESVTIVKTDASSELLAGAPKLYQVTNAVETLYKLAKQHQLVLKEVIYQDRQSKDKPLVEYAMDFRVQQSYPRIKAFMTELLAALPYLAMEEVSFEREDILSNEVQSHMQFTLFLERTDE